MPVFSSTGLTTTVAVPQPMAVLVAVPARLLAGTVVAVVAYVGPVTTVVLAGLQPVAVPAKGLAGEPATVLACGGVSSSCSPCMLLYMVRKPKGCLTEAGYALMVPSLTISLQ